MLWFVNPYFATAGKGERSNFPPTLFAHVRDMDVLGLEISQGCRKVVAHEDKLVLVVRLEIMKCGLKRGHRKNQPPVAGIDAGKLKYIAKKGPVGLRIFGVDNDM